MKDTFTIVFAGGGSGGHVYPMLAVIDALRAHMDELKLRYRLIRMGPSDGYGSLFEQHGVILSPVAGGNSHNYAKFLVGFVQSLFRLFFLMPDAIFSKGGTGALPVVAAGWFYRIPVVIHDSDAVPGRTNRASARFAKKIFVSFEAAAAYFDPRKTEVSGTPVRGDLLAGRTTKELAKETLGFKSSDLLLLILGGSQGAQRLNLFILENLGEIVNVAQVLHQAGVANLADVQKLSQAALVDESFRNRYHAVDFLDKDMGTALAAADLAVARAGSSTIFELAAFGIPAILIPIPELANDHQRANAYAYADTGAAMVIEEANLLPGLFLNQLKALFADQSAREKMGSAAKRFFTPDAAEAIAVEILSVLR